MIYVCSTGPLVAAALRLPRGVCALRHVNLGTAVLPLSNPSAACHALADDGTIAGSVLNFEPAGVTPTPLKLWPGIFKAHWPTHSAKGAKPFDESPSSGVCVAYGIDAGLKPNRGQVYDHPPDLLARALKQPTAKGDKVRWAHLGYDFYFRPGYEARNTFIGWTRHRAGRLVDVGDRNKCRSVAFIDIQRQFDGNDIEGDGLVLHAREHVLMQIDAVPEGVDLCIFARSSTIKARTMIDEAILKTIDLARSTKGTS